MYRPAREYPSFSSSLLDEIYRSIDERADRDTVGCGQATREKQSSFTMNGYYEHDWGNKYDHGRDCVIKRSFNSSSSSSDSSSGGGFSSSEAESVYGVSSRPKPIRTSYRHDEYSTRVKQMNMYDQRYQFDELELKQKHEGKFVKTKSRAMKIYGDLKKVKQPISPGGRLATFLNSLFTNAKNTKRSSSSAGSYEGDGGYGGGGRSRIDLQSKSAGGSTCSSASSFSRSCLSKTPSSRGKLSSNKKRSVRFYPVSVIVGDDCQPCGQKSLYGDESNLHALKFVKNPNNDEFRVRSNEKTRRIEEAARNLLRNYQKKVECEFDLITVTNSFKVQNEINLNYNDDDDDHDHDHDHDHDDEDDDDDASHTSSDLFELENLSAIGMDDELPVYETTHLDTNLALGNGFRM